MRTSRTDGQLPGQPGLRRWNENSFVESVRFGQIAGVP